MRSKSDSYFLSSITRNFESSYGYVRPPSWLTQGKHHIQVVVFNFSGYFTIPFILNCSEKPNSCFRVQLTIFKDMLDMFTDGPLGLAEKLGKLFLV